MTNTNEIKVGSQTNKVSIVWGFWVFAARPIKISIEISAARLIYFSKVEKAETAGEGSSEGFKKRQIQL